VGSLIATAGHPVIANGPWVIDQCRKMAVGSGIEGLWLHRSPLRMTYAHLLKNDDRHAAEQAASLLIGHGWDSSAVRIGFAG
jgi:hypothetical protein